VSLTKRFGAAAGWLHPRIRKSPNSRKSTRGWLVEVAVIGGMEESVVILKNLPFGTIRVYMTHHGKGRGECWHEFG
jgi:hypothetical protein